MISTLLQAFFKTLNIAAIISIIFLILIISAFVILVFINLICNLYFDKKYTFIKKLTTKKEDNKNEN